MDHLGWFYFGMSNLYKENKLYFVRVDEKKKATHTHHNYTS